MMVKKIIDALAHIAYNILYRKTKSNQNPEIGDRVEIVSWRLLPENFKRMPKGTVIDEYKQWRLVHYEDNKGQQYRQWYRWPGELILLEKKNEIR